MNSLKIQHQAFGQATDLAIANVHVKLHQEKEKQDGLAPMSKEAPVQAPSAKEIV